MLLGICPLLTKMMEAGGKATDVVQKHSAWSAMTEGTAPPAIKALSAISVAFSSILAMLVSKTLFATYGFRCVLFTAAIQYLGTVVILLVRQALNEKARFQSLSVLIYRMFVVIFPLPLLFLGNTLTGLGATRDLSLPMLVTLRRISIVMMLFLEYLVLHRSPTLLVILAVFFIMLGAIVAVDLGYGVSRRGLVLVLLNDVFTALQGVFLRRKMDSLAKTISSESLLLYSNSFALLSTVALLMAGVLGEREELKTFAERKSPGFLLLIALCTVSGFFVNYSTLLCIKLNSPLTTCMVGAAKNVVMSYVGMLYHDYVFEARSFLGICISAMGAVVYSIEEWRNIMKARNTDPGRLQPDACNESLEELKERMA